MNKWAILNIANLPTRESHSLNYPKKMLWKCALSVKWNGENYVTVRRARVRWAFLPEPKLIRRVSHPLLVSRAKSNWLSRKLTSRGRLLFFTTRTMEHTWREFVNTTDECSRRTRIQINLTPPGRRWCDNKIPSFNCLYSVTSAVTLSTGLFVIFILRAHDVLHFV